MENTQSEKAELKKEVKEKTVGYITAAFGLVAGLAWNDAVKALIESIYPTDGGGVIAKFVYAIGVTILLIFITRYIVKLSQD